MKKILILLFCAYLFMLTYDVKGQSRTSKKEQKTHMLLSTVKSYLGTPYKYGGMSRKGIDCSALLHLSYRTVGIDLARTARDQSKYGKKIKWSRLRIGDMVFFKFKQKGEKWWHSGVITEVSKNKIRFIHASSSRGVVESNLLSDYYRKNVQGFRRVI